MCRVFMKAVVIALFVLAASADPIPDILLDGKPSGCVPKHGHTTAALDCAAVRLVAMRASDIDGRLCGEFHVHESWRWKLADTGWPLTIQNFRFLIKR